MVRLEKDILLLFAIWFQNLIIFKEVMIKNILQLNIYFCFNHVLEQQIITIKLRLISLREKCGTANHLICRKKKY